MQSVLKHPEVVSGYLQCEVSLGRVKGLLEPEAASLSQVSPFGVIPKSSYVSVDNLIEVICSLGHGGLLATVDVQMCKAHTD